MGLTHLSSCVIGVFDMIKVLPGVYDVKNLYYNVKGVYSHTVPVDAYRGAGRPESIYLIERLMDVAAAELNIDRVIHGVITFF